MNMSERKPDLRCTFTDPASTPLSSYSWTDPNDIRPTNSGSPVQWAVSAALGNILPIADTGSAAGGPWAGVPCGAQLALEKPARKICVQFDMNENTDATNKNIIVNLRGSADSSTRLQVLLTHTPALDTMQIYKIDGATNPLLTGINLPADFLNTLGTWRELMIFDNGNDIIAELFCGLASSPQTARIHANTTFNSDKDVISIATTTDPTTGGPLFDNLRVWY